MFTAAIIYLTAFPMMITPGYSLEVKSWNCQIHSCVADDVGENDKIGDLKTFLAPHPRHRRSPRSHRKSAKLCNFPFLISWEDILLEILMMTDLTIFIYFNNDNTMTIEIMTLTCS